MKNCISFISVILILVVSGCQQPFDAEHEKESIIKVINLETEAYLNYDFETLAETHLRDSLNLRLSSGRDDYVFLEGWDKVSEYLQSLIEDEEILGDRNVIVEKSNYRIKVYPECAWVLCDEKWTYKLPADTIEINSIQVRFLEKVDDEWKIAFISFVGTSGYDILDDQEEISGLEEVLE